MPIGLGDGIDVEQTILAPPFDQIGRTTEEALAIDAIVDHYVRDVETLRSKFTHHTLGDHAQARLRRCKVGEARLAAQTAGSPREDHRAAAKWNEPAGRLATDEKAREATHSPEVLEGLGGDLPEVDPLIIAS